MVAEQSKMRGYGDAKNSEGISGIRLNIRLCERLVTLLARKSEMSSEVFQRKRQEGCRVHCTRNRTFAWTDGRRKRSGLSTTTYKISNPSLPNFSGSLAVGINTDYRCMKDQIPLKEKGFSL